MSVDGPNAGDTAPPGIVVSRKIVSGRRSAGSARSVGRWLCRTLQVAGWPEVLSRLFLAGLAATTISIGFAHVASDRILLPIEVLGADGMTVSRIIALQDGQAESVRSLWLQIHGLRYADQASVQVNTSAWVPLNNTTVTIPEPARSFGGIGGGISTLVMTLALPNGTVVSGNNTIRFRFNQTDGFVSAYRILSLNFLSIDGSKILPPDDFTEDAPESWTPPLPDAASVQWSRFR